MFYCNNAECGIRGDVVEFWYQLLKQAGLYRADWSLLRAAGDLIERVESGEIDVSIREFDDDLPASGIHRQRRRERDEHFARLQELVQRYKGREIAGSLSLPNAVKISLREVLLGLFPENRFIMLANKRDGRHHIMRRDVWLSGRYHAKPTLEYCSFVSQNYCSRADVDGTSYDAFEGIARRWMVMEADKGTLEQQYWLHSQLNPACVCWSGGKSLHAWHFVQGWTKDQCFDLFAEGIRLGVNDPRGWLVCQQMRLPAGFNVKTGKVQKVLVWNLT